MQKIIKCIKKLIESKFNEKLTKKDCKKIYRDLKNNKTNNFVNFLRNVIALDSSELSICKKLQNYWKLPICEHDIEFIDQLLSSEEKMQFINNKLHTNNRALICYKKDFQDFFKYQFLGLPISNLSFRFRDYIKHGKLYSTKSLNIVNLTKSTFKPVEQKLITENKEYTNIYTTDKSFGYLDAFLQDLKYESLNEVQKAVSKVALTSDDNFLVCAPTGIGKTIIAMMSIYNLVRKQPKTCKIAYIAPLKSLSSEVYHALTQKFYNLNIFECTSDTHISKSNLLNFDILVGTPEKIEILQRNNYMLSFDLMIFDEIHILNESWGHVIESLVMRNINKETSCRLIGMSATIYNYEDVANFLQCSTQNTFYFDESYRPIPIKYELIQSTNFKLDLVDLIKENNKPVLIFVHSREQTFEIAEFLINYQKQIYAKCKNEECKICECKTQEIDKFINKEVGIHHAKLSKVIKQKIEHLVKENVINILVSTSTLSYGVNLPIHTVIVLGTKYYNKSRGSYETLSNMSIKQMLGRAGRHKLTNLLVPCKGILLSENYVEAFFYEQTIESQLVNNLHNILLAQLQDLKSFSEIYEWFTKSYFFVRLKKYNQDYFKYSLNIIYTCLQDLSSCKMLTRRNKVTQLGKITSKYFVDYKDVFYAYKNMKNVMQDNSLLDLLSCFTEFKDVKSKDYPDIRKIIPSSTGISDLYQLFVSGRIKSSDLLEDNLSRILKCMLDVSIMKKLYVSKLLLEYYKSSISRRFIYGNFLPLSCSISCVFLGII